MEIKTFIDFLIEASERHGYDAKWMKTGEESDLGIFKCYQEAADLYAQQPVQKITSWQLIETAPKDGTEILAHREDAGVFMIRYTSPVEFLTESECEKMGEDSEASDWFYSDFVAGGRLEGSEIPTHWMPLPKPPVFNPPS